METNSRETPLARQEGLVIHELPDEVLVYDLDRHRSHCLNRTAALIWRHCDGRTTVAEMADLLQRELSLPASEDLVWLALGDLGKARLLQERFNPPLDRAQQSRRALLRQLGMAGGLALVTSIVAPEAAQAASPGCHLVLGKCTKGFCPKGQSCQNTGGGTCDCQNG